MNNMEQGFPPKNEKELFKGLKSKLKLFATSLAVVLSGHAAAQNLPNTTNEREPIIVHDPNDPRLLAYKDSLFSNKQVDKFNKGMKEFIDNSKDSSELASREIWHDQEQKEKFKNVKRIYGSYSPDLNLGGNVQYPDSPAFVSWTRTPNGTGWQPASFLASKKPVQPVEYQVNNIDKLPNNANWEVIEGWDRKLLEEYFPNVVKNNPNIKEATTLRTFSPRGESGKDIIIRSENYLEKLPVNKTKFNTDSNYSITSGIDETNATYFPDEEILNEAVTNLRTKYPKSVQSQKSKGTVNYDFPGASGEEVIDFDKINPPKQGPEASDSLAQKQ